MDQADQERYQGPERRRWIRISHAERAAILREASRAAGILIDEATRLLPEKARDRIWQDVKVQVGEVAIRIALYVAGGLVIAGLVWLGIHEKLTLGGG